MIEEPPILTIRRPSRRPTAAQIAAFEGLPTSVVSDAMMGAGVIGGGLRPLGPEVAVAGPALTAGCPASDLLGLLGALAFVQPGDVVVATFGGYQGCAVMGDRVAGMMRNGGAAGFVSDGPVRDADGILATGLPVWCTGRTPATPYNTGPGTVGLPVQIGRQQVETGDMIVADGDGVVVVPFARIDEVAAKARATIELERSMESAIAGGQKVPRAIEELLKGDRVRWVE